MSLLEEKKKKKFMKDEYYDRLQANNALDYIFNVIFFCKNHKL